MRPTHAEFEDYFRLHAQIASAEKEIKERGLKEKIRAWLAEGNASPEDLPYLAVLENRKKPMDWKGVVTRLLWSMFRSKKKVEERMKEYENLPRGRHHGALCSDQPQVRGEGVIMSEREVTDFVAICYLLFWAVVILVAAHFVIKYW